MTSQTVMQSWLIAKEAKLDKYCRGIRSLPCLQDVKQHQQQSTPKDIKNEAFSGIPTQVHPHLP